MRKKKAKEQIIAALTLCSVFTFFIYLKMNPEISATALSSESIETIDNYNTAEIIETAEEVSLDNNNEDIRISEALESIIEYTEIELKRAEAYLKRDWKPDHTINIAAWEYVSNLEKSKLEEKNINLDMDINQVVNVIK
ncbi:MAG: hypothetical protein CMG66_05095 [Candidatus Marinimicrobia bacterium]|nr:hypothetical protein [Candidatus Neomarinimicrobiota bacterium]|tara:strand:+ start:3617 stop:4033 length:417 start_codon:yes stop_codon:yes gene_type:complete